MSDLKEKQRKSMNKDVFAYVDENGEGHLPLNDESHVRNAMARFNQTSFPSASAKESARRKVRAAAKKHGIEISKDDNIAKPSSLRAAHTRRGPRGGRKTVERKRPTTTAQRTAARSNIKKAVAARRRRA